MFKDNLKAQIEYKGMIIKELAAKTGISKRTIDTYVDSRAVIPNAEIAVRLAKALDTTVEYLVTGNENDENLNSSDHAVIDSELYFKYHKLISKIDTLNTRDKRIVNTIVEAMN